MKLKNNQSANEQQSSTKANDDLAKPMKPKGPNKSTDEQQGATRGDNDLPDKKIELKRKQEENSAGNTCKKSKVS
jgi:hypothetical protein